MYQDELKRAKTKGMEIKNNEKVLIKISLREGGFWEKEYNQSDKIQKVVDDFKEENNEEIPEEYISDWKHNNQSLNFENELRTLLANEIPTLILNHEENENKIAIGEEKIPDLVGKPFNNPFEVFVFNKKDKILKIQKYDSEDIERENLDDYGSSSAYCNGNNYLFISGGEKNNMEIVDKLWKINLENQKIDRFDMKPKKNHSMIYIPGNYVFIVGGNDLKTFCFDIENEKITNWSDLNKKRIEPSLILIQDYLYCFDNINSKNNNEDFSFEKLDLVSGHGKWEIFKPSLYSLRNPKMNQKFFAVTKDSDENILFLGGNMDDEENEENQTYNYKYNMNNNNIEISDIEFKEYNFKEKTFLPYKENIDYILPDFNRHHPEIIFFQKNKNKLSLVKYEPKKGKKGNEEEEERDGEIKLRNKKRILKNFKYNFNMPLAKDNIENQSNNNEEKQIIINSDQKEKEDITENEKENNLPNDNSIEKKSSNKNDKINISISQNSKKINESNNNLIDDRSREKIDNISEKKSNSAHLKLSEIEKDGKIEGEIKINGPQINIDTPEFKFGNKPGFTESIDNKIDAKIDNKIDIDIDNKYLDLDKNVEIHLPPGQVGNIKLDDDIKKIDNQNLNINVPESEVKIEKKLIKGKYNFYMSGYIENGKVHIDKDVDINGSLSDINLKGKNISIKSPDLKADIKGPNVDIKDDIKIKGPDFNIPTGSINLKGPEGKIEGDNKLKDNFILEGTIDGIKGALPSAKVNLNGPKINDPNLNFKGEMPNVNIHPPDAKIKIDKDMDLSGIIEGKKKIDINAPKANANFDMNLKNGKHKVTDSYISGIIPGINTSKINMPSIKAKGPNINIEEKAPKLDINPGEINLPEGGGDINFKNDINIPGITSNMELPSAKLNIDGNLNGKDINIPKIDSKLPGLDINAPKIEGKGTDFEINGPKIDGKLNGINLKGPKINSSANGFYASGIIGGNIKSPSIKINENSNNIKLNAPKVDVKENIPNFDINGPKVGVKGNIPNFDINGPKVDVKGNIPDFNINAPKISTNGINGNIHLSGPNNELSGIIEGTKIKGKKINLPSSNIEIKGPGFEHNTNYINLEAPKIEGANTGLNIKGSNIPNINSKFDLPSANLNGKIDGNINLEGENQVNLQGINLGSKNFEVNGIKESNYDFFLSGIIPSKNDKNGKIKILKNYESGMKLSTKDLKAEFNNNDLEINKNFHGNINHNLFPKIDGEIKGSRKIEGINNDINLEMLKDKIELGEGEYGGELNIKKNIPTKLGIKSDYVEDVNYNVNDNINVDMKQDINLGNIGINLNLEGNSDTKVLLNSAMKKKGKGLPMVGVKSSNFEPSKIDTAGKFDADNINIDNLKSANVGVNGQKIGERIED